MQVYIGIDWSEKKHDICFLNEKGGVIRSLEIPHSLTGFVELDKARQKIGVEPQYCVVGLETAHNLLADYLWDQRYEQLYVLPPQAVKSTRGRFRQSGAKDDRWDAWLIANILRTDQKRYQIWKPDCQLTRQIRAVVSYVGSLTKEITRNTNRLRAVLLRYYPAALGVFSKLDSLISLVFIQTYPTPEAAAGLSFEDFKQFARQNRHSQPRKWAECYSRIGDPHPPANEAIVATYLYQAVSLASVLEYLVISKNESLKRLKTLYDQHPDRQIYASLPGAGDYLEPALLAKMGDDRQHYPTPAVLQAVAGTCPVTYRSGKRHTVRFRWACDREFRHIVQQWAISTLDSSPWAQTYYRSASSANRSENDAIRRLANRWLAILWKLWQDRVPYDQEYHLRQHALRVQPR